MNDEVKLIKELREVAQDHAHGEGYLHGLLRRGAAAIDALRTQVAELRAENEKWQRRAESARGLIRYPCKMWDGEEAESQEYAKGYNMALEHVEKLSVTPAPEVQCKACNDTACDPSHEELAPCPGCAAKPAHVDDFRGDDAALISSAKALLALDEKGALAGGGIGGHARTIIGAFISRMAGQGERQEAVGEPVAWCFYEPASEFNGYEGKRRISFSNPKGFQCSPLYTTPQPCPDVRWLVSVSMNILSKLQHPTACVDAMDMWKLEDALKPFAGSRQAQQDGEKK